MFNQVPQYHKLKDKAVVLLIEMALQHQNIFLALNMHLSVKVPAACDFVVTVVFVQTSKC